ncbi:MAG: hypothetical protein A07HR60_00270, partial [uncultured archaeon A07HR60]
NGHDGGIKSECISGSDSDSVTDTQSIDSLLFTDDSKILLTCQLYGIAFRTHTNRPSLQVVSLSSPRDRVIGSEVAHE